MLEKDYETRFEYIVAKSLKRFTRLLHLFFSIALVITVVMTLFIFFNDVLSIIITGNLAVATIHALGSLLILWTLSELLNAEIKHLQGDNIKVNIMIEVAIAAFVRKLLITSTEGLSVTESSILLAALLVLAIVYWFLKPRKLDY